MNNRFRTDTGSRPTRWWVIPTTVLVPLVLLTSLSSADDLPPRPIPSDTVGAELETSRAVVDFQDGRPGDAANRLNRLEKPSAGALYYRGLSLLALKQAEKALADFRALRGRQDSPSEVLLDIAVSQLSIGDAAGAEETLQEYVEEHPEDPFGRYFLGIALFRQKRYEQAVGELDQAASDSRLAPYRDFYRGLASYSSGNPEFRGEIESFQRSGGSTGEVDNLARRLLVGDPRRAFGPDGRPGSQRGTVVGPGGIEGPDPDRRYNLSIISGYEYDTNVALVPSQAFTPIGLGGGAGRRDDSRWVVSSFGEYRLVQNEKMVLGLIGSTYDSWQFRLDSYNFQDYMGGTYSNIALGERWILGGRYEFHESLLGGKQFSTDHRLTPNLTFREGEIGHTTAFYEFESLDITNLPVLVPAQVRSGNINSVGLTQAFYLMEGAGRLFLGYRFDDQDAQGTDYNRQTSQLNARLEFPLPFKIVGDVGTRYFFDNYQNPNSLSYFGLPRSDRRVEARIGLQKFFTRHLSMRAEYTYTNNDSNVRNLFNVSPFSYDRHLLSTLLIYDF